MFPSRRAPIIGAGGFNRSVQHGRFWVLYGLEVHEW
jgi:hypothetical protein